MVNAGLVFRKDLGAHSRKFFASYDLTSATTIQGGGNGIWNISAAAGAYDVTVADYDSSHHGDYVTPPNKPYIIVKCSADCSANNVTIQKADGVDLYVFAADYSANPRYVVLTLDSPTAGKYVWKLA